VLVLGCGVGLSKSMLGCQTLSSCGDEDGRSAVPVGADGRQSAQKVAGTAGARAGVVDRAGDGGGDEDGV